MEAQNGRPNWNIPPAPKELRLTNSESRLYIDVCGDLFDTFHALKKTLDEWESTGNPGKVFVQEACKIPVLINEMEQVTRNKRFAVQVTRRIYFSVFCADRPILAALSSDNQAHQIM